MKTHRLTDNETIRSGDLISLADGSTLYAASIFIGRTVAGLREWFAKAGQALAYVLGWRE